VGRQSSPGLNVQIVGWAGHSTQRSPHTTTPHHTTSNRPNHSANHQKRQGTYAGDGLEHAGRGHEGGGEGEAHGQHEGEEAEALHVLRLRLGLCLVYGMGTV
jgi:hypothetical protein